MKEQQDPQQNTSSEIEFKEMLEKRRNALDKETLELRERIAGDEDRLRGLTEQLSHMNALLGNSQGNALEIPHTSPSEGSKRSRIGKIKRYAREVLEERNGSPMYYRELAREVQKRGGDLVGANSAGLLVSLLVKDDDFVRPERKGYYALRADHPDAKNVGARKRRSRPKRS